MIYFYYHGNWRRSWCFYLFFTAATLYFITLCLFRTSQNTVKKNLPSAVARKQQDQVHLKLGLKIVFRKHLVGHLYFLFFKRWSSLKMLVIFKSYFDCWSSLKFHIWSSWKVFFWNSSLVIFNFFFKDDHHSWSSIIVIIFTRFLPIMRLFESMVFSFSFFLLSKMQARTKGTAAEGAP